MSKSKSKTGSRENFLKFWAQHPNYTAFVHITMGIGLGLLGQTFLAEGYVNTIGWVLVFLGAVGQIYPLVS